MKLRVPLTQKNFPGYNNPPQVSTSLKEQLTYITMSLSETARIACGGLWYKLTRKDKQP
jgi:hypothetical protein